MSPTRSPEARRPSVAVIVLTEGGRTSTWQYLGLRRSAPECVQDRWFQSSHVELLSGWITLLSLEACRSRRWIFRLVLHVARFEYQACSPAHVSAPLLA